jgi:hypothetical protein
MFSNNYCYNTITKSWWQLYPRSGQSGGAISTGYTFYHYVEGIQGSQLYAAILTYNLEADRPIIRFDANVGAPDWQWTSRPIHVMPNADGVITIRRLNVVASTNGSGSTIEVSFLDPTGAVIWGPTSFDVEDFNPQSARLDTGAVKGYQDIIVRFNGHSGSGEGPILHAFHLGYTEEAPLPSEN